MNPYHPRTQLLTHEVFNQPYPRENLQLWKKDSLLQKILGKNSPAHLGRLNSYAELLGSSDYVEHARLAQVKSPELKIFDQAGRRLDEVMFHPSYHQLMRISAEAGYSALPWKETGTGGHSAHLALLYLLSQVEPGVCCPLTMTYAAVPVLKASEVGRFWAQGILKGQYDERSLPAHQKEGFTVGMAMTEKQGGSDVKANTTRAESDGEGWRLWGHKWFCSAPMSDAFLTLAQTPKGLTCFLVPRWTPDGERNIFQIMRLKDKLGNRSNASSEIEYHGTWAQLLGEEGQGVKTIIEMVHHTRLDTCVAPVAFMRRALNEALWWARERKVFKNTLVEQPLMKSVLADLVMDWAGGLMMGFRVARAFDASQPAEAAFARLAVAVAKYWNNKICPEFVYEAMECLGGVGYVEESVMPMLYREAPLNSIWEGSGNVICLDVLRTMSKVPNVKEVMLAELGKVKGQSADYDKHLQEVQKRFGGEWDEREARHVVEELALLLQASELLQFSDSQLTESFIRTRLRGERGRTKGTIPKDIPADHLLSYF